MLTAFYILAGLVLLYYGGEFLVKGGASLAVRYGVSPLVIGLTLVAYATSAPELLVSIMSACSGNPDISIGNVVGSNICNIALILGVSALIRPLSVDRKLLYFDLPVMLLATGALAASGVFLGGVPSWAGCVFFLASLAYTWLTVKIARKNGAREDDCDEVPQKALRFSFAVLALLCGLAMLVLGSHWLVQGAVALARRLGVGDIVIGLTIVAIGTSMPELATSAIAARRGESDIAIGNIIGSCIFNVFCIMGIVPMIRPLKQISVTALDWSMFSLTAFLLLPMMLSFRKISRLEGALLLGIYIAYTAILVYLAGR